MHPARHPCDLPHAPCTASMHPAPCHAPMHPARHPCDLHCTHVTCNPAPLHLCTLHGTLPCTPAPVHPAWHPCNLPHAPCHAPTHPARHPCALRSCTRAPRRTWVGFPDHLQSWRAGRKAEIFGRFSTEGRRCLRENSLALEKLRASLRLSLALGPAAAALARKQRCGAPPLERRASGCASSAGTGCERQVWSSSAESSSSEL